MFHRKLLYGVAALALFALAVTAGKGGKPKPPPEPPPAADPAILYTVGYGNYDDQVWVMNEDGSNQTPIISLGSHGLGAKEPTWSGDNTRFAFTGMYAWAQCALYVADLDGSNVTKIQDIVELRSSPDWAAAPLPGQPEDDQRIVFVNFTGDADDLFAIRSDGTGLANLTLTPYRYEGNPSVAFDGTFIVYDGVTYPSDGGDGVRRVYKGALGTDANGRPMITSETCLTDEGPLATVKCWNPVVDPTGANVAINADGECWIIPLTNPSGAWHAAVPSANGWIDGRTVVYTIFTAKPRKFQLAKGDIHTGGETILDSFKTRAGSLGGPATRR